MPRHPHCPCARWRGPGPPPRTLRTMPEPALATGERRHIWLEIGVVIALGVFPHILSLLAGAMRTPEPRPGRDWVFYAYAAARNIQIIAPLLWIMARSGRPWRYY